MELVSTIEISGEEREIADAYAREQIDGVNSNLDRLAYDDVAGGKNIFDGEIELGNISVSDGQNTNDLTRTRSKNFIKVKPNTTYAFTREDGIIRWVIGYKSDKTVITDATGTQFTSALLTIPESDKIRTFTTSATTEYIRWYDTRCTNVYENVQIEEGATATPYKPYIPSVKMLADEVSAQNESLSALGKCKNLLNPSHLGTTVMGITCTNNGDGTYALNGTATADLDLCIKGFKNLQLNKEYKMLGCPSGGSDSTYMLYDSSESDIKDIGKGKVYTPTKQPNINIRIMNGVTVNNLVFKPMLTTNLSAAYDDFVPYTGDGDTLTEDVAMLKNDLSDSLPVGTILTVVDDTPMSSDMWRFLNTGEMTYQNGGALVKMGTMIYQKIK